MATLLVARLSPRTGELDVGERRAPPGRRPAAGRHTRLLDPRTARGIALGATDAATYTGRATGVEPGSSLLLYTDGLIERPDAALEEGLDALLVPRRRAPAEPHPVRQRGAAFFPTGSSGDDVALLGLHLHPVAVAPLRLELPPEPEGPPARARTCGRGWLDAGATEDEAADVLAAVSEALARGTPDGEPRTLRVELAGDSVEVVSATPAAPAPRRHRPRPRARAHGVCRQRAVDPPRGGGRAEGLRLVRRLSRTRPWPRTPDAASARHANHPGDGELQQRHRHQCLPGEALELVLARPGGGGGAQITRNDRARVLSEGPQPAQRVVERPLPAAQEQHGRERAEQQGSRRTQPAGTARSAGPCTP